jgi:anthranilate phosphoribosyltransferase
LLGPLSNPAGVKKQITGVFSKAWVEPLSHVLKNLGSEACWICHGEGGLDEIVPTGTTWISELKNGKFSSFEVTPEAVGLKRSKLEDLKGGDATQNATALRGVLQGENSAFRDAVVMTTGAALLVDSKVKSHAEGVRMAEQAIDSGAALKTLDRLIRASNS